MEHHGSLLHWLYYYHIVPAWFPEAASFSIIAILFLTVLAFLATRNISRVPRGLQNLMEWAVEGLENFVTDVVGAHGRKFTPLIGTFFIYILTMNWMGLLPTMLAPTSNLNTTIALGLCAIVAVHYHGIRETGFKQWAIHFVGEPIWLAPLMIPLHIVGEIVRPVSLALRLYGNIFGEETVIAILASFAPVLFLPIFGGTPILALPTQLPMLLFGVFTSFLQAVVFCMLVSIYIATTIGEHHGHGHESHEDEGPDLLVDAVPV